MNEELCPICLQSPICLAAFRFAYSPICVQSDLPAVRFALGCIPICLQSDLRLAAFRFACSPICAWLRPSLRSFAVGDARWEFVRLFVSDAHDAAVGLRLTADCEVHLSGASSGAATPGFAATWPWRAGVIFGLQARCHLARAGGL